MKIAINGKFLTQKMTGVQRVAIETLKFLISQKPESYDIVIFIPNEHIRKEIYDVKNIERFFVICKTKGKFWEQVELYWLTKNYDFLISFCNQAPLLSSNNLTYIHDTQVYLYPQSYSLMFRIWYKVSLPIIAKRAKRVITVSHFSKKNLVEMFSLKSEKVDVLYNGIEHIDNKKSIGKTSVDEKYALLISSLAEHKNLITIINSRFNLEARAKIYIIGDIDTDVFSNNNVTLNRENIKFLGRVSDLELDRYINNANLIISPSLYEGFGLPVLEALAKNVAVICSDIPVYRELFENYVNFVDPLSSECWAEEINKNLGNNNREPIEQFELLQKFSWKKNSEYLIDLVKELQVEK